jgi:hypothetical protein
MTLTSFNALVPKLCLGTHLSSKLCFAGGATELPGQWHSQTEFGNEESLMHRMTPSGFRSLISDL